jgi:hypothetical protein
MTIPEFLDQQRDLACRACATRGVLRYEHNPNNNALTVVCPCGSRTPLGPVVNLKRTTKKQRKDYPMGESPEEVWQRWGKLCGVQRCFFCTTPRHLLEKAGIGITAHHVNPYSEEQQHRGPIVPLCTNCHAIANVHQRLYWFIQRTMADGKSLSDSRSGISRDGISSDSLPTEEQNPAGQLEAVPKRNAHH